MTSHSMPSFARISAASSALNRQMLWVRIVISAPSRWMRALSMGTGPAFTGSSAFMLYSSVFSKISTGSGSANAVSNMPRASSTVAALNTLSPGMCAYQPSSECECWAASCLPPPVGMRITKGTLNCPPDMCRIVAALFRIWSRASKLKLTVMISTMGNMPAMAAPTPAPV